MDDLDSSDEESEDEDAGDVGDGDAEDDDTVAGGGTPVFIHPRTRAISSMQSASSARPSFMRLGNHSTPHITHPMEGRRPPLPYGQPSLPYGSADSKKPIGNVPPRTPFFSDKKSGKIEHMRIPPIPMLDFHKYVQNHPAGTEPTTGSQLENRRRSATGDDNVVRAWQSNQRAQESLRKLDGMLIQHMETEKDTIKRIATSAVHSKT